MLPRLHRERQYGVSQRYEFDKLREKILRNAALAGVLPGADRTPQPPRSATEGKTSRFLKSITPVTVGTFRRRVRAVGEVCAARTAYILTLEYGSSSRDMSVKSVSFFPQVVVFGPLHGRSPDRILQTECKTFQLPGKDFVPCQVVSFERQKRTQQLELHRDSFAF